MHDLSHAYAWYRGAILLIALMFLHVRFLPRKPVFQQSQQYSGAAPFAVDVIDGLESTGGVLNRLPKNHAADIQTCAA